MEKIIFRMSLLISWLPVIFYGISKRNLVSLSLYMSIFMIYILFILLIVKKRIKKQDLLLLLLIVTLILINCILNKRYLSIKEIRDLIYIFTLFITLTIANRIPEQLIEILKKMTYIPFYITLLFSVIACFKSSYDLQDYSNSLYLNFQNPNILANVLLIILVYLYLERNKKNIIGILLGTILLYLTNARSAFISWIIFLIFNFTLGNLLKYFFRKKIIKFIICNIPTIIVIIVFSINKYLNSLFSFNGKKGLSGRDVIWNDLLQSMLQSKESFILGLNGHINAHNVYMQILAKFGIVIFLLFIYYFIKILLENNKANITKRAVSIYLSIIILLLNNSFENSLSDGIIGMSYLTFLLLALLRKGEECQK